MSKVSPTMWPNPDIKITRRSWKTDWLQYDPHKNVLYVNRTHVDTLLDRAPLTTKELTEWARQEWALYGDSPVYAAWLPNNNG